MHNNLQGSQIITTIILCMVFFIHVGILTYKKVNPDLPEVKYYKKNIKDIDFPIAFQICIIENNNDAKKYWDLGYMDLFEFFNGNSRFNESVVGWAGHTENGSSIGSVEGLNTYNIKYRLKIIYEFSQRNS